MSGLCAKQGCAAKVGNQGDQLYLGVVSAAREWTTKHPNRIVQLKDTLPAVDKQWCLQMAHAAWRSFMPTKRTNLSVTGEDGQHQSIIVKP